MDDRATLTIGQLAERFGLKTSAIRYYERVGVLPEADREHGHRRYGPDAVRRLEVLDVAKRAGFSLDEARLLIEGGDAGSPAFESLRELAARKPPDVEALIVRAEEMRSWLLTATDCSCQTLDVCGLFVTDAKVHGAPVADFALGLTQVPGAGRPASGAGDR